MKIYLHSDNAEASAKYNVNVSPGGDLEFLTKESAVANPQWFHADGSAKQYVIVFKLGAAEVEDEMARYMVARGIAHKSRLIRKIRQLFDHRGNPVVLTRAEESALAA